VPTCLRTWILIAITLVSLPAGELRLAGIFTDHMVLQRDRPVPLWGWARPRAVVQVACGARKAPPVTADAEGAWSALLPAMPAGGPVGVSITAGTESLALREVLIGDVWMCSGQSNSGFPLGACDAKADIAAADLPGIRYVWTPEHFAATPQADVLPGQSWRVLSPASAGNCSAMGFYFARAIHREVGVPIGILICGVGGTEIECWMSPEAIAYPENAAVAKTYRERIGRSAVGRSA
jgi:sialate O-acetylesterase